MTAPTIIYDITRLVTRLGRATPNGIDRVDLEFARHFLGSGRASFGALMGHRGIPHLVCQKTAFAAAEAIAACWQEDDAPNCEAVSNAAGLPTERQPRTKQGTLAQRVFSSLRRFSAEGAFAGKDGLWPARNIVQHAPRNSVYLNVSQFPIWQPRYLSWLDARPDMRAAFFLHDLLPITYPEFFRAFEVRRHLGRVEAMASRASGIIVSGQYNLAALRQYLSARNMPVPKVHISPLSVPRSFQDPPTGHKTIEGLIRGRPYFVSVGTIEPRKNHLLLLNIWRELRAELGQQTPCLLVVGADGWESENVDDMFERCDALQGTVFRLKGCPTPELAGILAGAKALLMPTFAEGFGLPVTESLAAGTRVLASDIDVFRQIRSPILRLLDPLDGLGWLNAVSALATEKSCEFPRKSIDKSIFSPPTCLWSDMDAFLSGLC